MTLIPSMVPKERGNCRKEGATGSSREGSIISWSHILILGAGFLLLAKLPFQITHMNGIYSISFFNTNHAFCFYQFHPAFVAIFSSFPSQHIHCKGFLGRKSREGNILNACNISVQYSSENCRTPFQVIVLLLQLPRTELAAVHSLDRGLLSVCSVSEMALTILITH